MCTSYIYYTIHITICDACSNTVCQSVAQAISAVVDMLSSYLYLLCSEIELDSLYHCKCMLVS
jgi:hypothetical protein